MQTRYGTSFLGSISVVALTVLALVATSAPAAGQSAQVTFTRDVAPILQRSCQTCHREGSIAPMSLLTYEEARPWARSSPGRRCRDGEESPTMVSPVLRRKRYEKP